MIFDRLDRAFAEAAAKLRPTESHKSSLRRLMASSGRPLSAICAHRLNWPSRHERNIHARVSTAAARGAPTIELEFAHFNEIAALSQEP
eukprot:2295072-Amphidinium_carterae.1